MFRVQTWVQEVCGHGLPRRFQPRLRKRSLTPSPSARNSGNEVFYINWTRIPLLPYVVESPNLYNLNTCDVADHLYRITLELAKPRIAEAWVQGFIKASLHSPSGIIHLDLTHNNDMKLEHGSTYSIVLSHPADLDGTIKKVELSWEYDMNVLEPRTICLFWCNDHLYIKSVSVDEMQLTGRG